MQLPVDFITRTRLLLGENYDSFEHSLLKESPVSIRNNPEKTKQIPAGNPVLWSKNGYYLPERPAFTFDPSFHAGAYYVQEASSMFLEQAINNHVTEPVVCLDLCAAPGGKSTHLLNSLPEGSLLVSNEFIKSRAYILAENIIKWGNPNSVVTHNAPKELGQFTGLFDVIVADVPCSGEGMFRKDRISISEWNVANVKNCASRQKQIIDDIWDALSPDGLFIYSTCTYNTEENEENIRYIIEELGAEALPIPILPEWKITGSLKYNYPVYRFFPDKTNGEGFFLAVLRKKGGETKKDKYTTFSKKDKNKKPLPIPDKIKAWIKNPDKFYLEGQNDRFTAIPEKYKNLVISLREKLHVLHAGIGLGEIKGKDILPVHSLAMSTALREKAFPTVELSWEEAISYLRRENLTLNSQKQKGYYIVTFQERPLGFVKHLGNRTNNLYPSEWRIRSPHNPEHISLYPFK